jgi:serine/threonine protein kinase
LSAAVVCCCSSCMRTPSSTVTSSPQTSYWMRTGASSWEALGSADGSATSTRHQSQTCHRCAQQPDAAAVQHGHSKEYAVQRSSSPEAAGGVVHSSRLHPLACFRGQNSLMHAGWTLLGWCPCTENTSDPSVDLHLLQAKRGTPCYMAPELFSEGATHSTASDLWSLGCVLYECATGSPPFMDSSFNKLVKDILHKDPAPIPGGPLAGTSAA